MPSASTVLPAAMASASFLVPRETFIVSRPMSFFAASGISGLRSAREGKL